MSRILDKLPAHIRSSESVVAIVNVFEIELQELENRLKAIEDKRVVKKKVTKKVTKKVANKSKKRVVR